MQKIAIVSPRLPMGGAVGGAETLLLNLAKLAEMAQNFCTTGDPLTPPAAKEDDAQG